MSDLRAMLGGRHDQIIEAACYQIAYPTDDPGNDDPCPKPWHSTRCYVHDSDYPPAAAHRFCSFAVARAEKVLAAVLPDLLAQAWDEGAAAAWERSTAAVNAERYNWRSAGEPLNPYRQEADRG